jgi:dihydroorotate dehydrogenase
MPCACSRCVLFSELDTAPAMRSFIVGQRVDEVVGRGAGAHAHQGAGHHVLQRGAADQGLELFWSWWLRRNYRGRLTQSPRPAMALVPYALTRPFLFGLDPEKAHDLTMHSAGTAAEHAAQCLWSQPRVDDPVTLAGLRFPNRIGLGAGLDKNGRCIDGLGAMGFGHIEVGTVTPKAQPGNPQPRMFRLPPARALINRMGFNNEGLDAFVANVQRARSFRAAGGILGLNIGKNAATPIEHAVDDYLIGLDGVYPHADYVAVNISSPNTKNLRALQSDEALDALLSACRRKAPATGRATRPPGADVREDRARPGRGAGGVIAATLRHNGIDGVIATNTTDRPRRREGPAARATRPAALSGAPVFEASNRVIRQLRAALGPAIRSSAWAA